MKKIASNELKAFLQDWLNWAEGRESIHDYYGYGGLCVCTFCFDISHALHHQLNALFDSEPYPFGVVAYHEFRMGKPKHQDPNRLAWVRAALNDTLDTWELME